MAVSPQDVFPQALYDIYDARYGSLADVLALQAGQASGFVCYPTKAELDADLDHADNTPGLVLLDSTPANNCYYIKDGASGSGHWDPAYWPFRIVSYVSEYASLTAAVAAIGATVTGLLVDSTTTCTDHTVVPTNIRLMTTNKGTINHGAYNLTLNSAISNNGVISGSGTLTLVGAYSGDGTISNSTSVVATGAPFHAPNKQVFTGAGTVTGLYWVNARWFGAVGNGSTDDHAAGQLAIDAIASNAVETPDWPQPSRSLQGGTVYFPPGNYRTTGTWEVSTPLVNIVGLDRASTRIYADGTVHQSYPALKLTTHLADIGSGQIRLNSVKHISFWTDNDATARDIAIQVDFAEYMTLEDIYIACFGKSALDLKTLFESTIKDIYIFSSGARQITSTSDHTEGVINLYISDTVGAVYPCNNLKFYDVTLSGCYGKEINIVGANSSGLQNPHYGISFKGLRHETSLTDAGTVSNKDHIYISNAINTYFNDFLFALHPIAAHTAVFIKTVYNANTRNINFANGSFTYSATAGTDPVSLTNWMDISTNVSLTNVQFDDIYEILAPPLINLSAATADLHLHHVQFITPEIIITNLIGRYTGSKLIGDVTIYASWASTTPYKYSFENGWFTMYSSDGTLFQSMIIGDKIINDPPVTGQYLGKVCTTAGVNTVTWAVFTSTLGANWAANLDYYVLPTTPNGHVYKCTTAGNVGSSEPTWPTGTGQTVADGSVVWTEAGTAVITLKSYGAIL